MNAGNLSSETQIAFDTLVKKFKSANDIKLTGTFIYPTLSRINGHEDTSYLIRLLYFKQGSSIQMKAELNITRNVATLIGYDMPLTKDNRHEIDSFLSNGKSQILKSIITIPDSLKSKELNEVADKMKR